MHRSAGPLALILLLFAAAAAPAFATEGGFLDWVPLPETPSVRDAAGLAIDGPGRAAWRFGGRASDATDDHADLFTMDLEGNGPNWSAVTLGGGPSPRFGSVVHVDRPRSRILVLGGIHLTDVDGTLFSDVWAYDPVSFTWTELVPASSGPDTLVGAFPIAHDTRGDRLLFVLPDGSGSAAATWAFDLAKASWSFLATTGTPVGTAGGSAVFDSLGNRLLLLRSAPDLDLWQLDLASGAWSLVAPGATCPLSYVAPQIGYDGAQDRVVALDTRFGPAPRVAVYTLSGTPGWTLADVPGGPEMLDSAVSAAWDSWSGELVLARSSLQGPEMIARLATRPALSWTTLHAFRRPFANRGMAGTMDDFGRWMVHGGLSERPEDCGAAASCLSSRLGVLEADSHVTFEPGDVGGTGPPGLEGHSAVWDSIGQRALFFGGRDAAGTLRNEVWALGTNGPWQWTELATNVPGPFRATHGAAFDRVARRMYVLSGDGPSGPSNELWSLDVSVAPATWTLLATTMPASHVLGAGYDRRFRRLLFVDAGRGYAVALAADPPVVVANIDHLMGFPPRDGMMVAFDHLRNRLLCQGGYSDFFGPVGHAIGSLLFFDGFSFTSNFPEEPYGFVSGYSLAGYDPSRDRMVLLNGVTRTGNDPPEGFYYTVWALQFDRSVPTRLDFVEAVAEGGTIRVRFAGEEVAGALLVERVREGGDAWEALGEATRSAARSYEYADFSAVPGETYRYRGRYRDETGEHVTATSPAVGRGDFPPAALALRARDGVVGRGWPVTLECRLPAAGPATLELVDVRGRVVARASFVTSTNEFRSVALRPAGSAPGLYFARLRQGSGAVTVRLVRL